MGSIEWDQYWSNKKKKYFFSLFRKHVFARAVKHYTNKYFPKEGIFVEAGCWAIFYGFESMDQEILDTINKRITPEQIKNAVKWTKQAGIEVRANFILGLPNETPKKAKKMVRELIKMNPDYVKFNILTPYPGTKLYNQIKEGKWGKMTEESNKLTGYFPTFKPWGYKNNEKMGLPEILLKTIIPLIQVIQN